MWHFKYKFFVGFQCDPVLMGSEPVISSSTDISLHVRYHSLNMG